MFEIITDKKLFQFKGSKNTPIREFKISAPDKEILLVDFLSKALAFSEINNEFYFDAFFDVFDENIAVGFFLGLPLEKKAIEIKGVSYHNLKIFQNKEKEWQAIILFDL